MISATEWLANPDNLGWLADAFTVVGLPIAVIGLFFVLRQMRNDKLAVSAGAIAEMRNSMMERVDRLHQTNLSGDVTAWENEVSEFFNDLEMACAIYLDGQMAGRTGALAGKFIFDLLEIINGDDDLREEMGKAIHASDTFINIRDFRSKVRRHA